MKTENQNMHKCLNVTAHHSVKRIIVHGCKLCTPFFYSKCASSVNLKTASIQLSQYITSKGGFQKKTPIFR